MAFFFFCGSVRQICAFIVGEYEKMNSKQYLRAVLFNAPSTIGNYYTSLVAHDMASGALAPRKPKFGDPDYYSCNEGESL